jgi:hypothetical protein
LDVVAYFSLILIYLLLILTGLLDYFSLYEDKIDQIPAFNCFILEFNLGIFISDTVKVIYYPALTVADPEAVSPHVAASPALQINIELALTVLLCPEIVGDACGPLP